MRFTAATDRCSQQLDHPNVPTPWSRDAWEPLDNTTSPIPFNTLSSRGNRGAPESLKLVAGIAPLTVFRVIPYVQRLSADSRANAS
eukprot:1727598-Amphidinium_carterae.1